MSVEGLIAKAPLGATADAIVDAWVTAVRAIHFRAYRVSVQTGVLDLSALEWPCGIVCAGGWDYLVYVLPADLQDRPGGPWIVHGRPVGIDDPDFESVAASVNVRLTLNSPLMAAEAEAVSGALVDLFANLSRSRLDWPRLSLTADRHFTLVGLTFNEELLSKEGMFTRAVAQVGKALTDRPRPLRRYLPFAACYFARHFVWPRRKVRVERRAKPRPK